MYLNLKQAELPKYLTIRINFKIDDKESVKKIIDLISRYNNARDKFYKYIIDNYGDLKTFLKKEFGKEIRRYDDWKRLSENFEQKIIAGKFYHIVYDVLLNAKYSEAVIYEVYSVLKSLNCLRDKLKQLGEYKLANELPSDSEIEFKLWNHVTCIGSREKSHRGNRNVKFFEDSTLRIAYFNRQYIYGRWYEDSKRDSQILMDLIKRCNSSDPIPYTARVIVYFDREDLDVVRGQVHISLPIDYVLSFYNVPKYQHWFNGIISGKDVNADRINSVVVRMKDFKAIAWKTFWFEEANIKNIPRDRVWFWINHTIKNDIYWCLRHKCFIHVFEDYELIGEWKWIDSLKNKKLRDTEANWKMITFRSSIVEKYNVELYKHNLPLPHLIHPVYTSKIAKEVHTLFGWDVHTTSAYLIACFGAIEHELNQERDN